MSQLRHFLAEDDLSASEFRQLLTRASELRQMHTERQRYAPLAHRTLGMIFEKSSTRTRVSFEAGMAQLGGHAIFLSPTDTQLGRGEPLEDTAKVLSEMVDLVMIRTFSHPQLENFAAACSIPVINGLTDYLHPCQSLADMQTWFDHRGDISGACVTWVGDGNNVCNSYVVTAMLLGFELLIACPPGYEPDAGLLRRAGARVSVTHDTRAACEGADLIVTDVWSSMGQETEQAKR